MADEARFLAALPVIDDVTAQVCRRHHLSAAEAEEFRSDVRLHFIDRDYEVLRRFEGRSSLATYVTVVIQRLFLDRRNRQWGRWRPSAEARRVGPRGILLERLVVRDGWSLDQAVEMLRVNHAIAMDGTLQALAERLAARGPARRVVDEEEAGEIADDGPSADVRVVRAEQDFLAKRVQASLERARQALAPMDQLIIRMRFDDRMAVADIARALQLDQRRLYRTIERLLKQIGGSLAADGIARADIALLFDDGLAEDGEPPADDTIGSSPHAAAAKGASWLRNR